MISLFACIVLFFVAAYRIKLSLYVFVFLFPFFPRSLGLNIGGGSLSFSRIAIPLILIVALYKLLYIKKMKSIESDYFKFALLMLALTSCFKVVSSVINEVSIIYSIDDAFRSLGVFILFSLLSFGVNLDKLIKLLLISFIISFSISIFEFAIGHPLHAGLVNSNIVDSPLVAQGRNGIYRVQSLFDSPLFFAEYIVYCAAAFYYLATYITKGKIFYMILIFLILMPLNGSRSLILTLLFMMITAILIRYWRGTDNIARIFLLLFISIVTVFTVIEIKTYIISLVANTSSYQDLDPLSRSSTARARQFFEVYEAIKNDYIFGLGFIQNYVTEGVVSTLDNYFLRTLLEGGLLSFVGFSMFLIIILIHGIKIITKYKSGPRHKIGALMIMIVIGFIVFRLFLQDPSGTVLFYALIGSIYKKYSVVVSNDMTNVCSRKL